ncbi:unnamed protein product [Laminaria digitata]
MEFGGTEIAVSCYKQHDGDKLLDAKVDFLEDFDPGQVSDQGGVSMGDTGELTAGNHRGQGGKMGAANGYSGSEEENPSPYARQLIG